MAPSWPLLAVLPLFVLATASRAGSQGAPAERRLELRDVVRFALEQTPALLNARQEVLAAEGDLDVARSPFEAQIGSFASRQEDQSYPLASGDAIDRRAVATVNVRYGASVARQLRSGIVVTPSLAVTRTEVSSATGAPPGRASALLTVDVPLLRGRGGGLAAANERSAERLLEASQLDLRHTASQSVLSVVLAYWDYAAAAARHEVYRNSEARAERLVEETRTLVRAEERAASDLDQVRANLALKRASRIGAEQAVVDARAQLQRALGALALAGDSLPIPGTAFPDAPASENATNAALTKDEVSQLVGDALNRRADRAAAALRTRSATFLRDGAWRDARPGLRLVVGVGYSGIARGAQFGSYLSPLYQNVPGLNSSVQLNYDFSPSNGAARGRAESLDATRRQYEVLSRSIDRDIESGVRVASEAYRHGVAELHSSQEAVALARRAVENEKTKFTLGVSTQLDVILAEDALTNSLVSEIGGHLHFASAVARLRHETGTLVMQDGTSLTVSVEPLLSGALPDRSRR